MTSFSILLAGKPNRFFYDANAINTIMRLQYLILSFTACMIKLRDAA